jgi:CheY-like chemotaxis protein
MQYCVPQREELGWGIKERRFYPRHGVTSAATLIRDGQPPTLCWVKNLSEGGALLYGTEPQQEQSRLHLLLHLPWYQPIAVEGVVVYTAARGFGIAFHDSPPGTRVAIARAIEAAEQCQCQLRTPAVLVLTDREPVRQAMELDLEGIGLPCVVVDTPLDTIRWLQSWDTVIELVVVDLAFEQTNVLSFLRFLADEFPKVQRVVIIDGEMPTLEKVAYSFGRCSAVLEAPWDPQRLAQILRTEPGQRRPLSSSP